VNFNGSTFPLSGLIIYGEENTSGILKASSTSLISFNRDSSG